MWQAIKAFFSRLFATAHSDQVQVIPKGTETNPIPDAAKIEKPVAFPLIARTRQLVEEFGDMFNAPWCFVSIPYLGKNESDKALNAKYVPHGKKLVTGYSTLEGNDNAWCSIEHDADMEEVGIHGTGSAGASSWQKWAKPCPYWFGVTLPLEHQNGKHHVCKFLCWWDEAKKIALTLDGNKNNKFGTNLTDLSSHGDKVKPSPRWPLNWPDGVVVSKEELLKRYPFFAPGSSGTAWSTR